MGMTDHISLARYMSILLKDTHLSVAVCEFDHTSSHVRCHVTRTAVRAVEFGNYST